MSGPAVQEAGASGLGALEAAASGQTDAGLAGVRQSGGARGPFFLFQLSKILDAKIYQSGESTGGR